MHVGTRFLSVLDIFLASSSAFATRIVAKCKIDCVITGFWATFSPFYNNPEGNTLAATDFVRLLEVSGSVTAKQSNGKTENTQVIGSNSRV